MAAAAVQLVCHGCGAGESVVSPVKAPERSSSSSTFSPPSFPSFPVYGEVCSSNRGVASEGASRAGGLIFGATGVHGGVRLAARVSLSSSLASEQHSLQEHGSRRRSIQINSSKNGAANAISNKNFTANAGAGTELDRRVEEETRKESSAEDDEAEGERRRGTSTSGEGDGASLTDAPACSMPNFSMTGNSVTLLNPMSSLPNSIRGNNADGRPLMLYVPGMDGTGQGVRSQLGFLVDAGYDVRCVYIPSSDRSSWQQLVAKILPQVKEEVRGVGGDSRPLTIFGESFGAGLAIRLARDVPSLVTRLVLLNPATNFSSTNFLGSLAARTGLLALFPELLYQISQDILLPLLVKRNRVSKAGTGDFLSPMDFVPAACAAWRLSMLNDNSGLEDEEMNRISMPTLLIVSAKDRIINSMSEGARLQRLLPNAKRAVLPESGHTALFEDPINIVDIMSANGFNHPSQSNGSPSLSSRISPSSPVAKREEAVADEVMDEMGLLLEPWRILTSPLISGTENLPSPSSEPRRPLLFVGNHTMFGVYDSPILVYELYLRGFRCRGLAHPGHWITGTGGIFERYGNVKATKVAAYRLLKEGENVLLFPGGAREVCKRKGEEYKLLWKETADFVRMATRHKAIIVPFGALGGDEAYNILFDANEIRASLIGPLVEEAYNRIGIDPENVYPITTLPGTNIPSPIPFPKIERIYFHFAEPVDTLDYANYINDRLQQVYDHSEEFFSRLLHKSVHIALLHWQSISPIQNLTGALCLSTQVQSLYDMVKERVEDSIELLKVTRSQDPERELPVRLLAKMGRLLPEFLPRLPSTTNFPTRDS